MKEYKISQNCKNLNIDFTKCNVCTKCGKCGRRFRKGILVDDTDMEWITHINELKDAELTAK